MHYIIILKFVVIVFYIKETTSIDTYTKTRSLLNKTTQQVDKNILFKWNLEDKGKFALDLLKTSTIGPKRFKQKRLLSRKLKLKKLIKTKKFKTLIERNIYLKKLKFVNTELRKLKLNNKKQRKRGKSKKVDKISKTNLNNKKNISLNHNKNKHNKKLQINTKSDSTRESTTVIVPINNEHEKMSNDEEKLVPTDVLKHKIKSTEESTMSLKQQSNELGKFTGNYKIDFKNCRKSNGKCSCYNGLRLVSKSCVDINECFTKNGGCEGECINQIGYFTCTCPNGKQLATNKLNCSDINECQLNNGRGLCAGKCVNTHGSYYCSCDNLNGTKLAYDKHSCEDIDECLDGTSGCSDFCYNYPGKYYCSCPQGMNLQIDEKTCEDIDECQNMEIQKKCNYHCRNKIGSYECVDENDNLGDTDIKVSNKICPKIDVPRNGYFNCTRPTYFKSFTGRELMINTVGTICHFMCAEDYKPRRGAFICQSNGNWQSTTKYRFTCDWKEI